MIAFQPDRPRSVLVTGGAGFIGSHVVDALLAAGREVTVYDNLSAGRLDSLRHNLENPLFRFIEADLTNLDALLDIMPGHDLIWHLGANGDIPGGFYNTEMDLRDNVIATRNVLEAMRQTGVRDLIFSSSGAVYGEDQKIPSPESAGPLLPISLYAAAKIACEAFVSAFCHLFGLNAWVFRFGNVLGRRMARGVIYDFIQKLRENPEELIILGDGQQTKNYFLVEECIEGMLHAYYQVQLTPDKPCEIFNLGASENSDVITIADIVIQEMGLKDVAKRCIGDSRGWPGDQPKVFLNVTKMERLGWRAKYSSDEAVHIAAGYLVAELGDRS